MISLLFFLLFPQKLTPTGDLERSYRTVLGYLATSVATNKQISNGLNQLELSVHKAHKSLVNRHDGPTVLLENENGHLFKKPPILPAEVKEGDHWFFERHRFYLTPSNLYIYDVRIKGSRTLRIREIVLYFQDGQKRVFSEWFHRENGNGQAFSKRQFSEPLPVWKEGQPRQAKILESIEILGSAQDYEHPSRLIVAFTVPDPNAKPYGKALERIRQIREGWNRSPDRGKLWLALSDWHKNL